MNYKLYSNMKRMTTGFIIGIFCVTLSVLALRLTVFSDMAAAPEKSGSALLSSEEAGYQINSAIYFSSPTAKGDVFITNLFEDNFIKVNISLKEDDRSILTTGLVSPGASMPSRKMDPLGQQLEDGVYPCVAEISALDPEDATVVLGSAQVEVTVYIGEKPDKSTDETSKQ